MKPKSMVTAHFIWVGVVLFYLYQYILRVSPGVMSEDLMHAFQIDATGFGTLSAFATLCYALMQVPIGILVDVYGTRRLILASLIMCVGGVSLFASTDSLVIAYIARFLMGCGSACAFLSVSKVINEWFPDTRKGMMMGLTATAGTIGALCGGTPLVWLIEAQGWRNSLLILAAIGAGVWLINLILLPKSHPGDKEPTPGEESAPLWEIGDVFRSRQTWVFAFVAVGIYLGISVIADLWGVPFATQKFGMDKAEAAWMVSFIYIGTCFGCPAFAALSRVVGSIRTMIIIGALGVGCTLSYVVFSPDISPFMAKAAFFCIGFFAGAEILCFSGACTLIGPEVAGTMTGFLNCIVTLCGAIVQSNIGVILDYFWDGSLTETGVRLYSTGTYQMAFLVIIILTFSSFLGAFLIKNSKDDTVSNEEGLPAQT
jgi:sugar phosphate permease